MAECSFSLKTLQVGFFNALEAHNSIRTVLKNNNCNLLILLFCLEYITYLFKLLFRLHRMHEMQTIVIDVCCVSLSVCPSRGSVNSASLCGGHTVQPLPNYFGLLLVIVICFFLSFVSKIIGCVDWDVKYSLLVMQCASSFKLQNYSLHLPLFLASLNIVLCFSWFFAHCDAVFTLCDVMLFEQF